MEKTLFKYTKYQSLSFENYSIEIIDQETDNIICSEGKKVKKYTIKNSDLIKIKDIISINKNLEKIECIEFPPVLDGCGNVFEVRINDRLIKIEANNLWSLINFSIC